MNTTVKTRVQCYSRFAKLKRQMSDAIKYTYYGRNNRKRPRLSFSIPAIFIRGEILLRERAAY